MEILKTNPKQMYSALPLVTFAASIEPVLYLARGDTSDGSLSWPSEIMEMFARDETRADQWESVMKDWGCLPIMHFTYGVKTEGASCSPRQLDTPKLNLGFCSHICNCWLEHMHALGANSGEYRCGLRNEASVSRVAGAIKTIICNSKYLLRQHACGKTSH
jgi:hypothetical protein